ncbi:hypothetical protein WA026_014254 [Henosepilachna vigintioctopunctata]|uniref:Uncharacterized protein n=1 Tax=Henosepilachna vigintioctopunctata TaxID=420089 RepID=A0AAW1TXC4_9CUCU
MEAGLKIRELHISDHVALSFVLDNVPLSIPLNNKLTIRMIFEVSFLLKEISPRRDESTCRSSPDIQNFRTSIFIHSSESYRRWRTKCYTRSVMARRYLSDKELEIILNEGPDILADVPDNPLDDDSEEDMEHLEYQDHNSASEDEYVPEDSSDSDTEVQKKNVLWEKISKLLGIKRSFVHETSRMKSMHFCRLSICTL